MAYDFVHSTTIPIEAEIFEARRRYPSLSGIGNPLPATPWNPTPGSSTSIPDSQGSIGDGKAILSFGMEQALPPRRMERRNPTKTFCINCFAIVYFLITVVGIGFSSTWLGSSYTGECDTRNSIPTVELQFQINVPVMKDLSFAQAKLVDLVWDIGVGHGGRFLHGWVFYHIACKTITWILEYSALRYSFLLNMLFWPDSLSSLWSLVKSLAEKQRPRALLTLTILTYGVAHILFFTTLWSAATGYQSPSLDGYAMPDQSWVVRNTDTLRMCWSLDPKRLKELPGTPADGVILGPTFGSVFGSFQDINELHGMWKAYSAVDVSDDFRNLHACKRQKFPT